MYADEPGDRTFPGKKAFKVVQAHVDPNFVPKFVAWKVVRAARSTAEIELPAIAKSTRTKRRDRVLEKNILNLTAKYEMQPYKFSSIKKIGSQTW